MTGRTPDIPGGGIRERRAVVVGQLADHPPRDTGHQDAGLKIDAVLFRESYDDARAKRARSGEPLPFDLVISDIHMPGKLNGIDLAEAIQHFDTKLPVVLVTGYAEELERARHVDAHVLPKPFDIALLDQYLQTLQQDLVHSGAHPAT